MVAIIPRI